MNLVGADKPIHTQIEILFECLYKNPKIQDLLERLHITGIPNWYIGGGSVFKTVWNVLLGNEPEYGLGDYDIIYFDTDLTEKAESHWEKVVQKAFPKINVDVKNQARVHLWYTERFGGRPIPQFKRVEEVFAFFGITCATVGIRTNDIRNEVCAPYGFNDLFAMKIRLSPDRKDFNPEVYRHKANEWKSKWPEATTYKHPKEV